MSRISFLNQLAATESLYNFGAGVPPLERYAAYNEEDCLATFLHYFPNAPVRKYHNSQGFLGEIGQQFFKNDGFQEAEKEHIIVTQGVQEAIALACLLFRNEPIACIDPCYPGLVDAMTLLGRQPMLLHRERWMDEIKTIPRGSLFYLSSDFANPTGKQLTHEERIFLVEWAKKNGFFIFDDATYRFFAIDSPQTSLVSMAPENVFHAVSFSKILAPGLRMGLVHVPKDFIPLFAAAKSNISLNTSGYNQAIVGGWLLQNEFSLTAHLFEFKQELAHKKKLLNDLNLSYHGGFFVPMALDKELDFDWCAALLREEDVAVCPMALFSEDRTLRRYLRIAVAQVSPERMVEGIMKIHNFAEREH